ARAQLRKPSAAPCPTAGNRIQYAANKKLAKQKRPESNPLANRADDDVARRLHEHDFEKRQTVAACIVRRATQKKSLAPQEPPLAAANQEMIQRWRAAQIRGRSIQGHCAKLKRIADRIISKERKNIRREIQHHQMAGIFLAHQPA